MRSGACGVPGILSNISAYPLPPFQSALLLRGFFIPMFAPVRCCSLVTGNKGGFPDNRTLPGVSPIGYAAAVGWIALVLGYYSRIVRKINILRSFSPLFTLFLPFERSISNVM